MVAALDWVRLTFVSGIGLSSYWKLVNHFQHPSAVLTASKGELQAIPGLKPSQIESLLSQESLKKSKVELERLKEVGAIAVCYDDPLYPESLKQLVDPPPVLYGLGDFSMLSYPCVAMVGSRAATTYGKRIAFNLSHQLSRYGLAVVSGLALGIDAESHRGMLDGEGCTIAVLGCGLDTVYPYQNRDLFKEITARGLILSEYPLGTRPEGFRFPARNRIIAGLSSGVVVVEAAKKSGSLITAQIALDYGREVFAVPGQVDSFKSEGTHWLLKQGAKLVQSAEDIVEELNLKEYQVGSNESPETHGETLHLDPDALSLLSIIDCYPQLREKIIEKSGLSSSRVSELLLFLELEGLVELLPGDKLCKI